ARWYGKFLKREWLTATSHRRTQVIRKNQARKVHGCSTRICESCPGKRVTDVLRLVNPSPCAFGCRARVRGKSSLQMRFTVSRRSPPRTLRTLLFYAVMGCRLIILLLVRMMQI